MLIKHPEYPEKIPMQRATARINPQKCKLPTVFQRSMLQHGLRACNTDVRVP